MPAGIIDGKAIAATIRQEIKTEADALRKRTGTVPGLAVVLIGDDPASAQYVRSKGKACNEAGFHSVTETYPESITERFLLDRIIALNEDPAIHGILVQLPLPRHMNESRVIETISPLKDVDGFHPVNAGKLMLGQECFKPCTPWGIQELLLRSGNPPAGKHVVIAGRSNIVGKPIANMLLQKSESANAAVTVVHTGIKDMRPFLRQADILIAAIGKPEIILGNMLREGVVVIDVGINRIEDPSHEKGYRMTGDVHFESAKEVAAAITPVPGGVGPMTIAMLLKNTFRSALHFSS